MSAAAEVLARSKRDEEVLKRSPSIPDVGMFPVEPIPCAIPAVQHVISGRTVLKRGLIHVPGQGSSSGNFLGEPIRSFLLQG